MPHFYETPSSPRDVWIFIKGFESMLQTFTDCELLFTALSGEELFSKLEQGLPDILLLVIQLPDASGIDLCKTVNARYPSIRIVGNTT